MKFIKLSILIFSAIFMLNFFSAPLVSANTVKDQIMTNSGNTTTDVDIDDMKKEIQETAEKADFNSTIQKAREYSLPIFIVLVFIAIFLFLLGIMVPQLKVAAWSVLIGGVVFYILVNTSVA